MIKFQHVITPGKQLQLQLKWNPEKRKLTFSYQQGTQKYSSGRIAFNPSDTEVL
jgi:3-hydroxymyristoyl/3-hydroxydecanoyl-(acyl carrier protein) dehydratase